MITRYITAFLLSFCLISTAFAAGSSSSSSKSNSGNFEKGVEAVEAGSYREAITLFEKVVADSPDNADAWNYLGFSKRKLNRFDGSMDAYQKALAIDPEHLGANEYIGELYLQTDDLANAKKHLKILDDACLFGCEEYDDLEAAIAAYENR